MRRFNLLGEDEVSKEPQFEPLPPIRRKKPSSNPNSEKTKVDKQNQKHHQNQIESRSRRGQARSKLTSKKKQKNIFFCILWGNSRERRRRRKRSNSRDYLPPFFCPPSSQEPTTRFAGPTFPKPSSKSEAFENGFPPPLPGKNSDKKFYTGKPFPKDVKTGRRKEVEKNVR